MIIRAVSVLRLLPFFV